MCDYKSLLTKKVIFDMTYVSQSWEMRKKHSFSLDKPIGASPHRDYRSDEDGTILAHNYILHGSDW
jgi:hypothetical protein